jgi:hypothetical protein
MRMSLETFISTSKLDTTSKWAPSTNQIPLVHLTYEDYALLHRFVGWSILALAAAAIAGKLGGRTKLE